ncbi:MAG: hypothetical protein V7637_4892, partial [Mycobacteriales bacterium]
MTAARMPPPALPAAQPGPARPDVGRLRCAAVSRLVGDELAGSAP